jgi:peroxiredoxin
MKKSVILILVFLLFIVPVLQGCGGPESEAPVVSEEPEAETSESEEAPLEKAGESQAEAPRVGIFQGNLAPDFTLYDLEGNQVCLEDLRGRQVIVNFWQMSCGPCLAEKQELQAFMDEYGDENVTILSINLRDPQQRVEEYMEENGYTFQVLFDTSDNFAAAEYRVRATPTSIFIDEEGLVKHRVEGMMNVAFIKERLGIED